MTNKNLQNLLNKLILDLGDNPSTSKINKVVIRLGKELVKLTKEEKKAMVSKAIASASTLNKAKAIEIASTWSILSRRFNNTGKLIALVYDLEEAIDNIPLNMTKEVLQQVKAWKLQQDTPLKEFFRNAGFTKKALRNMKTITKSYFTQVKRNIEFERLPEHEPIIYVSIDDDRRSDPCGALHGTVWADKSEVSKYAQPLIHPNCRCKLLVLDNVKSVTKQVKYNDALKWQIDMVSRNNGEEAQRMYGAGHSNFKIIYIEGVKYIEYITIEKV